MKSARHRKDRPSDGVNGKKSPCLSDYHPEHRRVLEAKIGRPLRKGEVCHHINGDRLDNRPENLIVLPNRSAHSNLHVILQSQVTVSVSCATCLKRFLPNCSQRFCSSDCRLLSWAVESLARALKEGAAEGLRGKVNAIAGRLKVEVVHTWDGRQPS